MKAGQPDIGRRYGGQRQAVRRFPARLSERHRKSCAVADIMVPNMTEAALLVGGAYQEGRTTRRTLKTVCQAC